jgi:hypothetical protein
VIFGGFEKRSKFDGFLKGQKTVEKHEKFRFWDFGAIRTVARRSVRGALKLEIAGIELLFSTPVPRNGGGGFIEGGQRPVTAAPPFWVLAIWDLIGMTGRVYVRKVSGCNRWPAGSWQIPCRFLADAENLLDIDRNLDQNGDEECAGRRFCGRPAFGTLKMTPSYETFRVFGTPGWFWTPFWPQLAPKAVPKSILFCIKSWKIWKNEGTETIPKKTWNLDWKSVPKWKAWGGKTERFAPYLSQNRRFGGVAKIDEKWTPKWLPKATKMGPKITRRPDFWDFGAFWKDEIFRRFLGREKVTQNPEKSDALVPKGRPGGNFGSARRNARGHWGGKEGLKPLRVWQGS